jgi:hypothetical protein
MTKAFKNYLQDWGCALLQKYKTEERAISALTKFAAEPTPPPSASSSPAEPPSLDYVHLATSNENFVPSGSQQSTSEYTSISDDLSQPMAPPVQVPQFLEYNNELSVDDAMEDSAAPSYGVVDWSKEQAAYMPW